MSIGLPPDTQTQLSDSDADALFEEAREIERRRRRRRLGGASAIAGVALAAGLGFGISGGEGGSNRAGHGSSGAAVPASRSHQARILTETVATSSSVCSPASQPATAGDPPPGQCLTILPSGHRYQCPIGAVNSFGADASQAATDSACHSVAPPTLPTSWRPTVLQMDQVKGCLHRAGLIAAAGTVPPKAQRAYSDTPIATVLIAGLNNRPTAVSFYLTSDQATHAYQRILATVTRQGQGIARWGRVLYTWNNEPASRAATERACIQAA